MDTPLTWERELWSCRSLTTPRERYVLTDLRLRRAGESGDEIALQDIGDVERRESRLDRLTGTSTVLVYSKDRRRSPFILKHIRRGQQLAALLDLVAAGQLAWDPASVKAAISWEPRIGPYYREAFIGFALSIAAVFLFVMLQDHKASAIVYPPDDAVSPGGVKRDRESIVRFMESDVMPWAREALAPIVGGRERVQCETCHGSAAAARDWQMPAVAALPQPEVLTRGWEQSNRTLDSQMRNAFYGYIAESDNQAKAGYMREIVMPGMARLLHRPAYDFTKSYDYNRSHVAFGCYHCHRVA